MAQTDFGAVSDLQKKVWSTLVWKEGRDQSFWLSNGFVGSGTSDHSKPIHMVTELTRTGRGDQAVMPLVQDLQGDGIAGDNELEGNEEALITDSVTIVLDQLRNGIKNAGVMSEQKTVIRFREQAKDKLAFWLGDKIDELMFLTLSGLAYTNNIDRSTRAGTSQLSSLGFAAGVSTPTTGRDYYAGVATTTATLTTSTTMKWADVVNLCTLAKRKRLKPVRVGGGSYYCLVMSPEMGRDLKTDSDYKTIVSRGAPRSKENPLFTGAFAVVDGVMLYEHAKVTSNYGLTSGTDMWGSGSDVEGGQALLIGAQALGFAKIGSPNWTESDNQDYGNRYGIGFGRIIGLKKPVFTSQYDSNTDQDFSVISAYVAAAQAA